MQFDQLKRREFIALLGGAAVAWPVAARAQSAENVRRVGILWPGASPPASPRLESFREGLREAGFIDGENLVIELRYSKTGLQHLPELAAELVRLKVEVIEASGDFAPRVAQQATSTIPIVAFTDDVLGAGLVDSLSRPGGNTTGLTILAPELLTLKEYYVDVDISGGVSMGKTFADIPNVLKKPANMKVAMNVRGEDFIELFMQRVESLSRRIAD